MTETILCVLGVLAIFAFIYWKLASTDMRIPPGAEVFEEPEPEPEQIIYRFVLD